MGKVKFLNWLRGVNTETPPVGATESDMLWEAGYSLGHRASHEIASLQKKIILVRKSLK